MFKTVQYIEFNINFMFFHVNNHVGKKIIYHRFYIPWEPGVQNRISFEHGLIIFLIIVDPGAHPAEPFVFPVIIDALV